MHKRLTLVSQLLALPSPAWAHRLRPGTTLHTQVNSFSPLFVPFTLHVFLLFLPASFSQSLTYSNPSLSSSPCPIPRSSSTLSRHPRWSLSHTASSTSLKSPLHGRYTRQNENNFKKTSCINKRVSVKLRPKRRETLVSANEQMSR